MIIIRTGLFRLLRHDQDERDGEVGSGDVANILVYSHEWVTRYFNFVAYLLVICREFLLLILFILPLFGYLVY